MLIMLSFSRREDFNEGREMVLAPEDGHIFIFNALDLPVNNTCGEDMTVSGAIAIKYANCSIEINGIKYDGQVMEHKEDHIVLTTTISNQILINNTKQELNLEVLHLEDMRNLKKVVYIGKVQERHFSVIYGMLVLLTITVLATWRIKKTIFTPNAFLHNVAHRCGHRSILGWEELHIPVPSTTPPPKPLRATLF